MRRVTLTVLGVGKAFCLAPYYQANFLLTIEEENAGGDRKVHRLLIDCGGDVRNALAGIGLTLADIHAVYVSHLHADHIGGLEALGIQTFFTPGYRGNGDPSKTESPAIRRPCLFLPIRLREILWSDSLRGGMGAVGGLGAMCLENYFTVQSMRDGVDHTWHSITLKTVLVPHMVASGEVVMYNHGLRITVDGKVTYFTGDYTLAAGFVPNLEGTDLVLSDSEIGPDTTCHPRYERMRTWPEEARRKMWLYGHGDGGDFPKGSSLSIVAQRILAMNQRQDELSRRANEDGFAGFCQQGQVFDLTDPNTYP